MSSTNNYSILRLDEEKKMGELELQGSIIDLGGIKNAHYHSLFKKDKDIEIVVANYDSVNSGAHKDSTHADLQFNLENKFPLEDASFQNAILMNVLEHIYNYKNTISETARILKPNGKVIISVPFFFNIHGSPDDYHRYTKSTLKKVLEENNFQDIKILELGGGPFSVMFQTFGGSIPTDILKKVFRITFQTLDFIGENISKKYASIKTRVPLGYFVTAIKK